MRDDDHTTGYLDAGWLYPPVTLHTLHETPGQAARDLEAAMQADIAEAIGQATREAS